ncbi:MAG: winged helix-turn-helix domain-containing protein [Elusimicrobia bacterium]|nr:winged helix-turn-helix domain-containing protein [Elusimicrobiota bacterium]
MDNIFTDRVGATAGEIWNYLNTNGESAPIKIKASLGIGNTMLYLALGWLAREDKVNIIRHGHSYKISLK